MSRADRTHRFYAEDLSGQELALSAGEAHHALRVLRLKEGAEVELFDGRGRRARGRIAQAGRDALVVEIGQRPQPAERPGPLVHLAFAVPKGRRLDWLLEKATELGAASLRPVFFERSVAGRRRTPGHGGFTQAKRGRWLAHCISAAKQCGLDFLPEIAPPARLADFLRAPQEGVRLVGHAGPEAQTVMDALAGWRAARPVWLLVGPEGGLTQPEIAAAGRSGFRPVRLGRTTLRVETAAVALLAAVVAAVGA